MSKSDAWGALEVANSDIAQVFLGGHFDNLYEFLGVKYGATPQQVTSGYQPRYEIFRDLLKTLAGRVDVRVTNKVSVIIQALQKASEILQDRDTLSKAYDSFGKWTRVLPLPVETYVFSELIESRAASILKVLNTDLSQSLLRMAPKDL